MGYWRTYEDKSTRKGVFKSTFITYLVMGIIFCFISWIMALFGGNVKYSDSEKNRLNLLGGRLGTGVAIGFSWGLIWSAALIVNGIRNGNISNIIIGILLIPLCILLAIYCIRRYLKEMKNIKERNHIDSSLSLLFEQELKRQSDILNGANRSHQHNEQNNIKLDDEKCKINKDSINDPGDDINVDDESGEDVITDIKNNNNKKHVIIVKKNNKD